ncbi:MAG: MotA/TolQ/ExbB proton channel family protein [Gemmatimonadota bacterium]|nr:MAG: MotA/TolQ/ExbB proton channel family protein [Gemmatimonadota bacterium]
MFELLQHSGPFGQLAAILGLVVLALVVIKAVQLSRGNVTPGQAWENSLNTILFWGAYAAVLGFLGQCYGIYVAMMAIRAAEEIAPWVVAMGFLISFTSTLIGLAVLAFAALCWFALRFWSRRVTAGAAATA